MAKTTEAREDLLKDATALTPRAAFQLDAPFGDALETVVIGARESGAISIYFGEDPVVQFTAQGELRRLYIDGKAIKADGGKLAEVQKKSEAGRIRLVSRPLSDKEAEAMIETVAARLTALADALVANRYSLVDAVPTACGVSVTVQDWLRWLPRQFTVARSPHVG